VDRDFLDSVKVDGVMIGGKLAVRREEASRRLFPLSGVRHVCD